MPDAYGPWYDPGALEPQEATVAALSESGGAFFAVLDRSVFYPEGGGQPSDRGRIGESEVVSVRETEAGIVHELDSKPAFRVGDRVSIAIDRAWRRYTTQQHSGQHLLSAILERRFGIHTIGFHLGLEYCTIDVSADTLDEALLAEAESEAEVMIRDNLAYSVHLCPPEDPSSFDLRKTPPEGESVLRVVRIGDYDAVACCGTHVRGTGEIRLVRILKSERYKGHSRLYFVSGDRAIGLAMRQARELEGMAALFETSAAEVRGKVDALIARCGVLEAERAGLLQARAEAEVATAFAAHAGELAEGRALRFVFADRDARAAELTVKAGAAAGRPTLALSLSDLTVSLLLPRTDATKQADIGKELRSVLQEFGGKGGGGTHNFRAAFGDEAKAREFAERALRCLESAG